MARGLGLGGIVNAEINIEQLSPTDSLADRLAEIDDEELPTGLERIRLINNSTMLATPKNESPSYSTRSNESRRRGWVRRRVGLTVKKRATASRFFRLT